MKTARGQKPSIEESLGRLRQGGVVGGVSGELHQLGEVAAMQGDTTAAAAYYAESLDGTGTRENLVGKLVAVGRLAAVGGHAETAARVLGAAEAIAETIGYVRRRPEQERLERDAAVARAALGDAGFDAAWAAGQTLRDEQAVAEAHDRACRSRSASRTWRRDDLRTGDRPHPA